MPPFTKDLRSNLAAQVILLVAAIGAFVLTGSIDMSFASELEILAGPRRYPRIILIFFIVMNLLLLGATLGSNARQAAQAQTDEQNETPEQAGAVSGKQRMVFVFIALGAFVFLFETVGYLLITGPLLVFVALMNGAKFSFSTVAICIAMLVVCLIVFRFGINIVLPEGLLGIDSVF